MFKLSKKEKETIKDILACIMAMGFGALTVPLLDGDATFCAFVWFIMILVIGGNFRYLYYLRVERFRRRIGTRRSRA